MANVEGVMQMRELPDGVVIPAGGSVELAPSGTHLMLIQVDHALRAGETVPVVLRFAKAGTLKLNLPVSDNAP
jgi:periplasmic copper chaperone A